MTGHATIELVDHTPGMVLWRPVCSTCSWHGPATFHAEMARVNAALHDEIAHRDEASV